MLIDKDLAKRWVPKFHYSGTLGNPCNAVYLGIVDAENMLQVVVICGLASNPHGVAKKYDLTEWPGNVEILRVAAYPNTLYNAPSKALSLACDYMRTTMGLEWLFSYADTGQGHHGGIYQALNAVYVGMSPAGPGWLLDGVPIHPRLVVKKFGTQATVRAPEIARERGHSLVKVDRLNTPKHLYILPIGGPASRRAIRKHLAPYTKSYPKREEADGGG